MDITTVATMLSDADTLNAISAVKTSISDVVAHKLGAVLQAFDSSTAQSVGEISFGYHEGFPFNPK